MEVETKVVDDNITRENENPEDVPYISPEIAAAMAGEEVVFDMDLTQPEDEDETDTDDA